jgi:ABC-type molybdate transport system permease subunit
MASLPWARIGVLSAVAFGANVPLGQWRQEETQPFSWQWFTAIHASVPVIILLRRRLKLPGFAVPFNIAAAICGQLVGGRLQPFSSLSLTPKAPKSDA